MSSDDGKKALVEEFGQKLVISSNDLQQVPQNANYQVESSDQNWTTTSAGKIPTEQKIPEGPDEQCPIRYVVFALPAPSQAEFYERMTRTAEEEAARKGKGKGKA